MTRRGRDERIGELDTLEAARASAPEGAELHPHDRTRRPVRMGRRGPRPRRYRRRRPIRSAPRPRRREGHGADRDRPPGRAFVAAVGLPQPATPRTGRRSRSCSPTPTAVTCCGRPRRPTPTGTVAAVQAEMESRAMSTTGERRRLHDPAHARPGDHAHQRRQHQPAARARPRACRRRRTRGRASPRPERPRSGRPRGAEAADGSPTLAAPSIPMFLGDAFVPYSLRGRHGRR